MTIYDIFERATELGIAHDFRPRAEVLGYEWTEPIRDGADRTFVNPYPDSGVVWAPDLDAAVARAAVGLDIGQGEILTIKSWEQRSGRTVDLFIGHHPRGKPLRNLPCILKTQLGNLASYGVDVQGLEAHFDRRVSEMELEAIGSNHFRTRDSAALLGCNYLALHSPADNLAARHVEAVLQGAYVRTLGQALEALLTVPEYRICAAESYIRPRILVGEAPEPIGKVILTEFTGGEEGPIQVYRAMKASGVDTIVVMHLSSEALAEAKRRRLNVIATGHTGSDSIGLNLLCDLLEREGVEIVPLAGFIRHSRN